MTISEFTQKLIESEPYKFQKFCETSKTEPTVTKTFLISGKCTIDFYMQFLNCMESRFPDDIESTPLSPRITRKRLNDYDEFDSFAEECLDITNKWETRVLREDLYMCYLGWCQRHGISHRSDKWLYKMLRDYIDLDDGEESESIEFQNSHRKRGFKGVRLNLETEWLAKCSSE